MVRELKLEITDLIDREDKLWLQRSKVLWEQFGDENSKFFHIHASQRIRKNSMQKIRNIHGVWRLDREGIIDCLPICNIVTQALIQFEKSLAQR